LLADLVPADLERVAQLAGECGYGEGEVIAAEGEIGEQLHIVIEGTIRIIHCAAGTERELARRTAGDVVGEMSIIRQASRIASLVADGAVRTVRLGRRDFESMLRGRPGVALAVMRELAQRLAEREQRTQGAGPQAGPGGDVGYRRGLRRPWLPARPIGAAARQGREVGHVRASRKRVTGWP
jgi:CRP-like cAMP-binding protein